MLHQTQKALTTAVAELLGDLRPLLEQVGAPANPGDVSSLIPARPVQDLRELRTFLWTYHAKILQPLELPAIQRAFTHASRNEARELIALDHELSGEPVLKNFASPSRLVGRSQLERLRPLRDERMVQRYLAAVERDEAHGWHTLVYGVTLAVYSLPLRQGLLGYAAQTTRGFIQAAAPALSLALADCDALHEELCARLSEGVESLLAPGIIA